MTSIISSPPANPTGRCSHAMYSEFPTKDVACAVAYASDDGLPANYSDLMKGCCKDAPVDKFADGCGLYCLSIGQSVTDLTTCFQKAGIQPSYIFCNGNASATATATKAPEKPDSTKTGKPENPQKSGMAASLKPEGVSKAGLGMVGLLFMSAVIGALM